MSLKRGNSYHVLRTELYLAIVVRFLAKNFYPSSKRSRMKPCYTSLYEDHCLTKQGNIFSKLIEAFHPSSRILTSQTFFRSIIFIVFVQGGKELSFDLRNVLSFVMFLEND